MKNLQLKSKSLLTFILIFMATSLFAVNELKLTDNEKDWLKNNPEIKIAVMSYWEEDNNGDSMHANYINLIKEYGNINIISVKYDLWAEGYNDAINGTKIHGISDLSWSKEREKKYFDYTNAYAFEPNYLIVKNKTNNIKKFDDLKGKIVYLKKGSITHNILNSVSKNIKKINYSNDKKLYENFFYSKKATAIITCNKYNDLLQQYNLKVVKTSYNKYSEISIGINKKHLYLASIIDKIYNIIPSSKLTKLRDKIYMDSKNKNKILEFNDHEKNYLKEKKTINMCIDPNAMPYEEFNKEGIHIGMTADFFKIFGEKVGIDIVPIKTDDWSQSLEFAKQRKCDILSLAKETTQRKNFLAFTKPYIKATLVIATKPHITYIQSIEQLKGKKVGIVKNYAIAEIFKKKYSYIDFVDISNINDGLKKVINGKIFAFVGTLNNVGYLLQKKYAGEIKISGKFDEKWEAGIAVRNDDKILFNIFEKAVSSLEKEQKQEIYNRWISVKLEHVTNYKYIKEVVSIFLIFLFFAVFWMRKLSKANKQLVKLERKTKAQKSAFEAIYNGSKDAIAIIDMKSNFLDVNPAYLEMTGFTKEELLLTSCIALTQEKDIESSKKALEEVLNIGFIKNFEKNCLIKNNEYIVVDMSMSLLKNPNRVILSVRDVTLRKKNERLLLETKLKAEESAKAKSEFLANMSHEIRTPMNGIIGMAHLALETNLNNKQKNYINKIDNSAKNLLGIINDILDFSKIEAGKLSIENINFDLKETIGNLKNLLELKAYEKDLHLAFIYDNKNSTYYGDPLRINQILINLVNNAIKFTEKGKVEIIVTNLDDNKVKFEIKDTGIGLTQKQQDSLFKSFSQADGSTTRKYGGTGLGLTISKQLIELMHGKIWVKSTIHVGSDFIFEIDLPKGNIKEIAKNINKKSTNIVDISVLKGSKVLFVEDNKINQEIILGILEHSGIDIDIANNGKEAVNMYKENPTKYELILMDLQMPIMDGFEATKIIRKSNTDIPIIALTANVMKEDIIKTKNAGLNEHLNKPVEIEKLFNTLLKYISKKEDKNDFQLPEFNSIDTKLGLSHFAGKTTLYTKILNNFYNEYKDLKLEELNDKDLKRVTHTLKGLSSNIGAINLSEVAEELEKSLDKELFSKLYKELHVVIEELSKLDK